MASNPPHEILLAIARSYDWVREHGEDNHGEAVEEFLKTTGLEPGYPWCAAFVAFVGKAALGERWPLKLVAGCVSLYDDAKAKGLVREEPAPGYIFLLWYAKLNRYAHTGFVVGQEGDKWVTVEGNASDPSKPASRNGWGVFVRRRAFNPKDVFIKWWKD